MGDLFYWHFLVEDWLWAGMLLTTEATTGGVLYENVFLEILQNS